MTKEKLASLTKYANQMRDRLSSPIPAKHVHRPEAYLAFLTRELKFVTAKIEAEKMTAEPKAGK